VKKTDPVAGVAVSVTSVPCAKGIEHVPVHEIPDPVTDPAPYPWVATDSVVSGSTVNVAVTDCGAVMSTVHDPVPLHAPPHPEKVDPGVGEAFSVTAVVDP
jgi:hypothetical protein